MGDAKGTVAEFFNRQRLIPTMVDRAAVAQDGHAVVISFRKLGPAPKRCDMTIQCQSGDEAQAVAMQINAMAQGDAGFGFEPPVRMPQTVDPFHRAEL